jgi:sugar phosphate isomerase/epimerase
MHERISVNSLCFAGAGLADLAIAWQELRPPRVSFTSGLVCGDPTAAADLVRSGGYRVETIWHQFVDAHLDCETAVLDAARAALLGVLDVAQQLGARSIYLTTGGHGSLTWEQAAERFAAAIDPCVSRAADAGIDLLIENAPPLRADRHLAHSLRDTTTLAEMSGVGVCLDVNGCWSEADLHGLITAAMPRCRLVQLSDYVYGDRAVPGRAVPGDGDIPLERIVGWVVDAGYTGAFDLELIGPRIDQEGHLAAATRACEAVGRMLEAAGA